MMPHALLWHSSDRGDVLWKAKVSLCSLDRLAPRPCGIVGKYLQPSHGNEIAPRQVCDLGVPDMDWTRTRLPLRTIGTFCLSLFSCFFICASKTTQQQQHHCCIPFTHFSALCLCKKKVGCEITVYPNLWCLDVTMRLQDPTMCVWLRVFVCVRVIS